MKYFLISGNLCDECIKFFGYKKNNIPLKIGPFKYKLFSNETFKKIYERLPINNLEANIHYGDEWIYSGLPSIELFLTRKSPIKILSNLINKENNNSLPNKPVAAFRLILPLTKNKLIN